MSMIYQGITMPKDSRAERVLAQFVEAHGCRLSFSEPVRGPVVLGALCHFGLGLFLPVECLEMMPHD